MVQLGNEDKLPRFTIQSDDLGRVQPLLGAVSMGDERGVAARLEALETSTRQGMDEMKRLVASVVRGSAGPVTSPPVIQVTAAPTLAAEQTGGPGARTARGQAVQSEASRTPTTFLSRDRQEDSIGAGGRRQDRSSSAGKRQRTNEEGLWQEQRPYSSSGRQQRGNQNKQQNSQNKQQNSQNRLPVIRGTSGQFAELAGPATFWVGKCRPELDESRIKEIITKCAESCSIKDFVVEDVRCLTKEANPWTKSFKVSVPARFESAMLNPQMYLGTWEARPFTRWPSRKQQDPAVPAIQPASEAAPLGAAVPPVPGAAALPVPGAAALPVLEAAALLVPEAAKMSVDSEAVSQ